MVKIKRRQKAVYWGPVGVDAYGKTTFADPVEMNVRWEYVSKIFINPKGKEERSNSVVYPEDEVLVKGYMAPIELTSLNSANEGYPEIVEGAREIRSVDKTPDIKYTGFLIEVYL
jgi:hypothetical protein